MKIKMGKIREVERENVVWLFRQAIYFNGKVTFMNVIYKTINKLVM